MARQVTISGANIKILIGGETYNESQSVSYAMDFGVEEEYGVDSMFPQEIAATRFSVQGTISGVRVKLSGGVQGRKARTLLKEIAYSPYVSIRIIDRSTDETLLFIPQAMVSNESVQTQAKGIVRVSFSFKGIAAFGSVDLQ